MAPGSAVQPHAEQALHKAEEAALHQHLCQQQSARNAAAYCKNVSRRNLLFCEHLCQASRDSGMRFFPSRLRMIIKFKFLTLVFKWVEIEEGVSRLVHKENMQSKFF